MAEAMPGNSLQLERRFKATRERVFRAWTDPEKLKRWMGPGDTQVELATVDLRTGGSYRINMRGADGTEYRLTGEYREIEQPARLVFTWVWEHDPDAVASLVTVEFRAVGNETDLRLTHSGLPTKESSDGHEMGWNGSFDKLATVV